MHKLTDKYETLKNKIAIKYCKKDSKKFVKIVKISWNSCNKYVSKGCDKLDNTN